MDQIVRVLLWFSAVGCGMMAGLYFAFSAFIMTALARLPQSHGVAAMQSINAVILKSWFMPLFYGTTLAALALIVLAALGWSKPGAPVMAIGGAVYVLGMFGCTVALNVPLNLALDAVAPGAAEAAPVWARYLKDWTLWNHVRVLASAAGSALFIAAIVARS